MAKKKVSKKRSAVTKSKTNKNWAGFSSTQLIVIFAVFILFAVMYLM